VLESPKPILIADLFPEILDHLLELLSGLSREDWQLPTVCDGWNVQDVALHLLGVDIGNLSIRRDGHVVSESIQDWDELVDFINEWNQDWVRVARRMSPALLTEMLCFVGEKTCDHFRLLNPHLIGGPVSWAGPEPAPVWLDIAREYTERWHHQQHIRDAVNRPGLKEPRYFAPVLATFVWGLPHAFRSVRAADRTTVTLTILGESGGSWSVRRENDAWQLYAGTVDEPDAAVQIDEDIAWRLFTNGIEANEVERQMAHSGDQKLARNVLKVISIIA
jgi:uncharacterized protein (TIGR03083 family)